MIDLLFGTTNPGKIRELRRLVAGLPLRVLSPEDLGAALPDVEEDGRTFRDNAEKKASAYARWSGRWALADDSGLCVDALGGAPGIHSARWSEIDRGRSGSSPACALADVGHRELGPEMARAVRDEANNAKMLAELEGVEGAGRGAEYRAVLALARPDGAIESTVEGVCRGRIGEAPRGSGGFGYDPLFVVDAGPGVSGLPRTMAELSPDEKDAVSHRGDAFRKLLPVLRWLAAVCAS